MSVEDVFTPQHRTLRLIATAANFVAWAALAFYLLFAVGNLVSTVYTWRAQPFLGLMQEGVDLRYINLALRFVNYLLDGGIYWLILKGVAVGLNMLVETDCNYRLRATQEASDE